MTVRIISRMRVEDQNFGESLVRFDHSFWM
jgi:hypothetical protein